MIKIKKNEIYTKSIDKKRIWKNALLVLTSIVTVTSLSACSEKYYEEEMENLKETIENLEDDLALKETEIENLHIEKEGLEETIKDLKKETANLETELLKSIPENNEEIEDDLSLTNGISKDSAYRIFYDEDGFLDIDYIGDAFQFSGAEDYQMTGKDGITISHQSPINLHKMGEYFVELRKNGVGYLVKATDYTDVLISGLGLERINELSTLVYCSYYDPQNGGKDSTEGYPGYIIGIRNKNSIDDKEVTIYDFDTFEVLVRDCILDESSLAWQWGDRRNLIHIAPFQTENGLQGEYYCTIIKKEGVNYLVDYSTFKVLAEDVEDFDCEFDEVGVRIITIEHSNGKKTVYLNDTLQPIETDVLTRKLEKKDS